MKREIFFDYDRPPTKMQKFFLCWAVALIEMISIVIFYLGSTAKSLNLQGTTPDFLDYI